VVVILNNKNILLGRKYSFTSL